jgi:hypothetical protein
VPRSEVIFGFSGTEAELDQLTTNRSVYQTEPVSWVHMLTVTILSFLDLCQVSPAILTQTAKRDQTKSVYCLVWKEKCRCND